MTNGKTAMEILRCAEDDTLHEAVGLKRPR